MRLKSEAVPVGYPNGNWPRRLFARLDPAPSPIEINGRPKTFRATKASRVMSRQNPP